MDLLKDYIDITNDTVRMSGGTHDMLHIHAGLALYLGTQLLLRTRRASLAALAVVVTAALGHEAAERLHYESWRWADTRSDIMLTVMWPAAITFVGLYRRRRWSVEHRRRATILAALRARPNRQPARSRLSR